MRAEDWEVLATLRRQAKMNQPSRVLSRPAKKRSAGLGAVGALMVAIVLAIGACSGGVLEPKTGPGTDYPCGTRGRSCGGGLCCGISQECGYGLGCPAGYCCPLDDDFYGTKKQHKQWPAATPSAAQ